MFYLVEKLRLQIGDISEDPNLTNDELEHILSNAAREYSRIKGYLKIVELDYDKDMEIYNMPTDFYKAKKVILKSLNKIINFSDNINQLILNDSFDVESDTLKITYIKYFSPTEIDEREQDLYFMLCEALCFKLMASKTADLIKFSTGEKIIDESLVSEKYLDLYKASFKDFKRKIVKAYGKKAEYIKEDLDYLLPYPPKGEQP